MIRPSTEQHSRWYWMPFASAATAHLHRGARLGPIGAENAAVSLLWPQQDSACAALVVPETSICRHFFIVSCTTIRANQLRDQLDVCLVRRHSAHPVNPKKKASVGRRTKSRYPTTTPKPIAPSVMTRTGVKQQIAVTTAPTSPIFRSRLSSMTARYGCTARRGNQEGVKRLGVGRSSKSGLGEFWCIRASGL